MLNEKFQNAYQSGLVVTFPDKIVHRVFIRLYTYGAYYPEKYVPPTYVSGHSLTATTTSRILVTCIKFLGVCLCPRCLAKKVAVENMGTPANMEIRRLQIRVDDQSRKDKIAKARKLIFRDGVSVNGVRVQSVLADESLVAVNVCYSSLEPCSS